MSLQSYLRAAPKAELHVHLEGSILPATLLELARRNLAELPAHTVEGLREWFVFRDFPHFIQVYGSICRCLKTAEDYELIACEFGAEMARQNVRYAEVTFSPAAHAHRDVSQDTYMAGLTRGRERARKEFGVEMRWVFDIVRSVPDAELRERYAEYTTKVAIEGKGDGVVALGLGGNEVGYPPEWFERWFDQARAAGLHSAPHAGETVGPESIWGALRALGAERLGHGVRAGEDTGLVTHLVEGGIPLEVSPTSNICLGIYPSLAEHPLRLLHDAGVIVTVNSDDPPLFNTTLNDEVAMLADAFGFDLDTIEEILLNGVRYSFLPEEERARLEADFQREMNVLRAEHINGRV
jgi:adenosine deaminase